MDEHQFDRQIEVAQKRLQDLLQQVDQAGTDRQELVSAATQELSNSLEELHVVQEELRQQNEELQATREQLEAERQRYQELFAFAPDGYLVTDAQGMIQEANQVASELLGVEQDRLAGKALSLFMAEGEQAELYSLINHLRPGGEVRREPWETWFKPRDGAPFPAAVKVAVMHDGDELMGLRWLIRDITERKEREQALRDNEERLRLLFNNTRDGVFVHRILPGNQPGPFVQVNDAACAMLGYSHEELSRMTPWDLDDPDSRSDYIPEAMEQLQERGHAVFEAVQMAKGGSKVVIEVNASVCKLQGEPHIISVVRDITARKEAEEKLQQYAQDLKGMVEEKVRQLEQERAKAIQLDKLAALGEMAAGVAHELNQPLTAIRFEADYLDRVGTLAQNEDQRVDTLLDAAQVCEISQGLKQDLERCRRLIDHLQDFGRISEGPPEPICLNHPIEDCLILVGARLRDHDIDLRLELADDLPLIEADRFRLEQVFLNLISNAEDAMEERAAEQPDHRKELEITTANTGDEVIATVRDNGCGIPEDIQERIFDPFFTTKPRGEGTGLGLSISFGIVTKYGGEITCESIKGKGTTFILQFPIIDYQ
jgi:PAS domain S-box-containing protein